jgi:hypothetical protein
VLHAKPKGAVLEQHWATLVEAIAAGDQLALHALYEMAHRFVFTLIMRIASHRETAEELTIDVFHDVWRRASRYNAANRTVRFDSSSSASRLFCWLTPDPVERLNDEFTSERCSPTTAVGVTRATISGFGDSGANAGCRELKAG